MRIAFGVAFIGAACVFACGSSSSNGAGSAGSAGASTAGSSSSGGGSSSGGSSATGGEAGDIGAAGVVEPVVVSMAKPHAAGGLVAGGVSAHSANFSGVFTLGAAPGGNGVLTSGTKQLRGGIIGASQK
jgi:hypothetical protein